MLSNPIPEADLLRGTVRFTDEEQVREKVGILYAYCLYNIYVIGREIDMIMFSGTEDSNFEMNYYCKDI